MLKFRPCGKLEDILGAIPEIGSVQRWQGRPIDLDHVKTPALFLWEEDETREKRNRLAMGLAENATGSLYPLDPGGSLFL